MEVERVLVIGGMLVVIVGACVSLYDKWHKRSGPRGRLISLAGVAIAAISLLL